MTTFKKVWNVCYLERIEQIFYCQKNILNWISSAGGGDFVGCPFFHSKNLKIRHAYLFIIIA